VKFKNLSIISAVALLCGVGFLPLSQAQEAPEMAVQESEKQEAPAEETKVIKDAMLSQQIAGKETKEFVRQAWELSGQAKLEELNALVDEALSFYEEKAKALQATLSEFPATTQHEEYIILNDVGTLLFIQAEALMKYGRTEDAVAAFENLIKDYPFARAWDPRGWYWSIAEKSQASIDVMLGKVEEPDHDVDPERLRTLPVLAFPGKEQVVDYRKYGEFQNVGSKDYQYKIDRLQELKDAVGEGIYPDTNSVFKNPAYRKAKDEGRLEGSHWDSVHSDDLEAALFKWITAKEPWGVKLFYIAMIYEKAGMYYEAIKAYHAIVVHFPQAVAWTSWNTPWYPAQAAIGKIKYLIRFHPELGLGVKWMKSQVKNGFDNDIGNDVIVTYPGVIYKKTKWDQMKEAVEQWIQKDINLGKPVEVRGQGRVQLHKYSNGHWQLLVGGKPYVIHGITYTPTKIGQSPDNGTLVSWMYEDTNGNGLADGPYDAWVDKNKNNVQDGDEPTVGDFQILKEMGVNTIREYHQPFQPNKELLRKMHEQYGFMVILGDFLGKYTLGSGASWFEGTDYEKEEHRKNMMDSVRRMVEEFKDEPYILLWLLGNENNYGVASNADQKPEAYYQFVNEVAKMIKSIDPDHPVAVCNGDTLYLDLVGKHAPDVDIYAANVYRGNYGFGAFWEQVQDATGKPAFITEFGSPAYARHMTMEEAEHAQALYHRGNWMDIEANLAGTKDGVGNALGGVVFQSIDEWWKNYEPFYHDRKSDAIGPFPGGYYFEEWFGIMGQGDGTHSPFLRQLREAYFAYQEMWTGQSKK